MRTKLAMLLGLALVATALSCDKDDDVTTPPANPVYNLRGNANGGQEVPTRVTTTASGTITGTYNKDNNTLTYTINWTGLTGGNPSAMHFHGPADPGVPAGVAQGIAGFPTTVSGSMSGTATLTDTQENDLLNGLWYYNIHNATYPGGEIRGQIYLTQ